MIVVTPYAAGYDDAANDDAKEFKRLDERIEALEDALLKIREIALAASPAQAAEINEIAKTGFKGREGYG